MNTSTPIERLETRIAPATIFVVDNANNLLRFDSATPGTIAATAAITGLAGGGAEKVLGLDARTATSEIFALGVVDNGANDDLRIYRVDPATGAATQVGAAPINIASGDGIYGFDFNPTVDRIRIVTGNGESIRVNPNNGALAGNDTDLNPAANDITAAAYDRNVTGGGASGTTLYAIDLTSDQLVTIGGINSTPSPNGGVITNVGPLGVNITGAGGFDIQGVSTAFAALNVGGVTSLFSINLTTGAATLVGAIGGGGIVHGLTVAAAQTVLFPTPKTATYLDLDGDKVTVTVSKGALGPADVLVSLGGQLSLLNLADDGDEFTGANITITVKKAANGDGLANIGRIDSTGHDLGIVTIKGSLGEIIAGDTADTVGIAKLSVQTLGGEAFSALASTNISASIITGKIPLVQVRGDVNDFNLSASALGSVTIGGSVIGNAGGRGEISGTNGIASLTIKGDLIGATNGNSNAGRIDANAGDIGRLTIGGSIVGGANGGTGFIFCGGTIKQAFIGGSLIGGKGVAQSGAIRAITIGTLNIGGSVIGGTGESSGEIIASVSIGSVQIGGNLAGVSINGTDASVDGSGFIQSGGTIGTVQIGGSIITGSDNSSVGTLTRNASIAARGGIGKIIVKGSIIGNATNPAVISVENDNAVSKLAIGSIAVGGSVFQARILAGFDETTFVPANSDVHIGTVTVARDWVGSSISAGIIDDGADGFGINDASIGGGGDPAITSRIARIQITGSAYGLVGSIANFGFVAQEIGAVKISSRALIFQSGPGTDTLAQLIGTTGTFRAVEFP